MDSNHLRCIFYQDSYTGGIFEGMFAKYKFVKEYFEKETYMFVVNEQDSQFPESHWVMVYQEKKKAYFIDSFGRDFTHYGFKFKRPVYQVSRRLQCLDSKLCGAYFVLFGCRLARGLLCGLLYGLLYIGLQIQRQVHLPLYQGKTINSKNNTRRLSSTTSSFRITSRKSC